MRGERNLFFQTTHHTIVDRVIWRIWMDDLKTAYGQALRGEKIVLPAKTHTYRDYAKAMKDYRSSYALSLELPYWKKLEARMLRLETSANRDFTRRFDTLSIAMSVKDTDALLRTKLNVLRLEVNDLLLTALGQGCRQVFDRDAVSIHLEGHGREELGRKLSIDQAIGWFTSMYPVVLKGFTGDARGGLIRVKETLRAIPNKGVGYNILTFVRGAPETDFQTTVAPLVTFNYLGDVSSEGERGGYFEPDSEDSISADLDYHDPRNHAGSDLTIKCLVDDGRFSLWLDYNTGWLTKAQAEDFAEAILTHQAGETKPHDFCPLANIQNAMGGDIRLSDLLISFEKLQQGRTGRKPSQTRLHPGRARGRFGGRGRHDAAGWQHHHAAEL